MYRNDYNKTLERIKTAGELSKDFENLQRCDRVLREFDREQAISVLTDVIRDYKSSINTYGFLFDGVRVVEINLPRQIKDEDLTIQIRYIMRQIPAYILLREGEKELAKRVNDWINHQYGVPQNYYW